jgi:hypothetical protein
MDISTDIEDILWRDKLTISDFVYLMYIVYKLIIFLFICLGEFDYQNGIECICWERVPSSHISEFPNHLSKSFGLPGGK